MLGQTGKFPRGNVETFLRVAGSEFQTDGAMKLKEFHQKISPLTSWDLEPRHYLFGDNSALDTFNQPTSATQSVQGCA